MKYNFASNLVINELITRGLMSEKKADFIKSVSGNETNISYAIAAMNFKVVDCKYIAVVAVFARIAAMIVVGLEVEGITKKDCSLVCAMALKFAKFNDHDAQILINKMVDDHVLYFK